MAPNPKPTCPDCGREFSSVVTMAVHRAAKHPAGQPAAARPTAATKPAATTKPAAAADADDDDDDDGGFRDAF